MSTLYLSKLLRTDLKYIHLVSTETISKTLSEEGSLALTVERISSTKDYISPCIVY